MILNNDQMQRQMDFNATIHALFCLKSQGVLTDEDVSKARSILVEKYKPIIQAIS